MAQTHDADIDASSESILEEYILGVRIVAVASRSGERPRFRFEAPGHEGKEFDNPDLARLYADIYFDVNGFEEVGTGERGIPPEIIQAGRDTLAAYFLTQPYADINWVASFYGKRPSKIERYVQTVQYRAAEIRDGAAKLGIE